MSPSAPKPAPAARNPGPSWGFRFIRLADRVLPEPLYRPLRLLGVWVSLALLPERRRHSRDYLRVVLGREPRLREVFRHFDEFSETLLLKLRLAEGRAHRASLAPGCEDFARFIDEPEDALLGTFHFAHSDLIGFLYGGKRERRVHMVRLRVGNSHDVESLGRAYGRWISFIWVNEGENLLFALKDAIAAGGSLAMKCDRLEFSSKTEPFRFLGARRLFPFTLYHLAIIFGRPVFLCVGTPGSPGETVIHSTPRWAPDPAASRAANLASARAHFQGFLDLVERLLRQNPYWWFNYLPLNPEAPAAATPAANFKSQIPNLKSRGPAAPTVATP
jgi:predicted LPLAT superfamily acyltransferase